MSKKKYLCPCCKKYVFEEGPGSYEICPVCSWEDDKIQAENPDYKGGANKLSLNECIKKFNSVLAIFLTIAVFIAGLSGCGTASVADDEQTFAQSMEQFADSIADTSANVVSTDVQESTEFVIVSTDGYIRTYFNPDAGIAYYNRQ